ncbi:MAG: undecaprenyl-diphosphatase UppP [Anaerolineae bacterium]|nr:undecaprenyl-diphosphatase UppP [Anaerolineae bacterium]
MDLFHALILGLIQGATEYIPVSSSAHLVLVPWFLGWPDASFAFEVLVQWGTLVGVFIFFWPDLMVIIKSVSQGLWQGRPLATFEAKLGWLVVAATIPAVILGWLFKDYFEATYDSPALAGVFLICTALLLVIAERFGARLRDLEQFGWLDAFIVGVWQAAAMFPGVSRSGATISGAVLRGFNRTAAARFSFLMSIPALLGAGVMALKDLLDTGTLAAELPAITVGFIAAAVSGYLCIRWLLYYLQRHSLYVFAAYCAIVSIASIILYISRG